jgi:hypothetical protein
METIALKTLDIPFSKSMGAQNVLAWYANLPMTCSKMPNLILNLGIGLSGFRSALATIFLFKPQSVSVSVIFLTVISYFAGKAMSPSLPRNGSIGRWLNRIASTRKSI